MTYFECFHILLHHHKEPGNLIVDYIQRRKQVAEWNKEVPVKSTGGQKLLSEEQGAINGFSMGVTYIYDTEYQHIAAHDDQEGFYVISGEGFVRLGYDEYRIEPGMSFIARAGEEHVMRKTSSEPIRVVWAHGPVE